MNWTVSPSSLEGTVRIPGSKSHTIRALICALYAPGGSVIREPLISSDTLSGKDMASALGADIAVENGVWRVTGRGVKPSGETIDVGNSGTSLYFGIAAASLSDRPVTFTGDEQICRRSAAPLLSALESLGVKVESTNGCTPLTVTGPIRGGTCEVKAVSSQYLSALLLACPLAENETVIEVPLLNEKPYVEMTLAWLDRCGIRYENRGFSRFVIPGKQSYEHFDAAVCNPPFHASAAEAREGTQRKWKNLGHDKQEKNLNFGGTGNELWCKGGEAAFAKRMIAESVSFAQQCRWFTILIAKDEHLKTARRALDAHSPSAVRTLDMELGNKKSRILAWSFA